MPALESLSLESLALRQVPAGVADAVGLTYLSISDNEIRELPAGLAQLKQLEHLSVARNAITELPDLSTLGKLKRFNLYGNDFTGEQQVAPTRKYPFVSL